MIKRITENTSLNLVSVVWLLSVSFLAGISYFKIESALAKSAEVELRQYEAISKVESEMVMYRHLIFKRLNDIDRRLSRIEGQLQEGKPQ